MKVMSFNVKSDPPWSRSWLKRRELVAGVLHEHQPDFAGLQEATFPMILDLHDRLPGYRWVGAGRDDGKERGEFTPIFFRADRWELQEHASFWLAATCDLPGRGWDAHCCRVATWARFSHRETSQRCVHFNTHLDHFGKQARAESASLILRKIQEIGGDEAVFLTGDFNCSENSIPYRILTGQSPVVDTVPVPSPVRDVLKECQTPVNSKGTYRGWTRLLGVGRIDYIFIKNGVRPRSYEVLDAGPGASDHHPIIAELEWG